MRLAGRFAVSDSSSSDGNGGRGYTESSANRVQGSSCPSGQEKVGSGTDYTKFPMQPYSLCVPIKQAAPAPAPAPKITVAPVITTAVSPSLQQQFTPQVSPVFQQSSGSGGQSAGTTQQAGGGQSGAGGGSAAPGASAPTTGQGVTANDLLSILNAQAEQSRRDREAQQAEAAARQKEQQEFFANQMAMQRQQQEQAAQQQAMERAAQQQAMERAAQQQAAMAIHSQYTGPVGPAPESAQSVSAQAPTIARPIKKSYTVPIAGAVILTLAASIYLAKRKGAKK